jgi:hypothetical protein
MPRLKNRLHERFAHLIAEGLNYTEAYRKLCPHVAHPQDQGCVVARRTDVKQRISEIQAEVHSRALMCIDAKRDLLRQMIEGTVPTKVVRHANGTVTATFDRLAALTIDAKMAGEFAPEQVEVKGGDQIAMTFEVYGRNHPCPPKHWVNAATIEVPAESVPVPEPMKPYELPEEGVTTQSLDELQREAMSIDEVRRL